MTEKFLHIGMMKCGSTSVQTLLAALEQEGLLTYLGFRPGHIDQWWRSDLEHELFDIQLRSSNDFFFKKFIDQQQGQIISISKAANDFWISCENLSGSCFFPEISRIIKLTRISTLYDFDCIILALRPLTEILKSWYLELNKRGIQGDVNSFIKAIILRKHQGFFLDLLPEQIMQDVEQVFKGKKVEVFSSPDDLLNYIKKRYKTTELDFFCNASKPLRRFIPMDFFADLEKHRVLWDKRRNLEPSYYFSQLRTAQSFIKAEWEDKHYEMLTDVFSSELASNKFFLQSMNAKYSSIFYDGWPDI